MKTELSNYFLEYYKYSQVTEFINCEIVYVKGLIYDEDKKQIFTIFIAVTQYSFFIDFYGWSIRYGEENG